MNIQTDILILIYISQRYNVINKMSIYLIRLKSIKKFQKMLMDSPLLPKSL